jgi:Peptidase inhibitor I78 family
MCDASKAQSVIGRSRSAETGAEALRLTGAKALRWIAPGTMVTMDYREDRLNLRVDPAGKVVKVDCG